MQIVNSWKVQSSITFSVFHISFWSFHIPACEHLGMHHSDEKNPKSKLKNENFSFTWQSSRYQKQHPTTQAKEKWKKIRFLWSWNFSTIHLFIVDIHEFTIKFLTKIYTCGNRTMSHGLYSECSTNWTILHNDKSKNLT